MVISLDGIGAFDHVQRSAIMQKLLATPELHSLVPYVRLWYGRQSRFLWTDDSGTVHEIEQGEGGEQGDPLMPALFALAQHDALIAARAKLHKDDLLFAFLDDLYVVTTRERAREAFNVVTEEVSSKAGIHTHLGKLRLWSKTGGERPPGFEEFDNEVWAGGAETAKRGIKVLGTPRGHSDFVAAHADKRITDEKRFLDKVAQLGDLQCAWLLLTFCAVPRANHMLRILPPSAVEPYAKSHDDAIWGCFCQLMECQNRSSEELARHVATLPARKGGLGLRSAQRTSTAAYWAAWVDSSEVLAEKAPTVHKLFLEQVRAESPSAACIQELQRATQMLADEGCTEMPTWEAAAQGAQAPYPENIDAGEWRRGWQYHASSAREHHFSERVVLPASCLPRRAMLLSQQGPGSGRWMTAIPSSPATTFSPVRMQVSLRRRLRWPLPVNPRHCNGRSCMKLLDPLGDHWASCMRSGRVRRRACPLERTWARVFREAGARVQENKLLRDLAIPGIDVSDGRKLEVVATGLPVAHGVPLGADTTMVSPLHCDGQPWARADSVPGLSLERAENSKTMTYPELVDSDILKLTTLACEVGGRWSNRTADIIAQLATSRARAAPRHLQLAARISYETRWWNFLSCAQQDALAATLVDDKLNLLDVRDDSLPLDADVVLDSGNVDC